jgi:capsular polysaccharide biosynthesis protein
VELRRYLAILRRRITLIAVTVAVAIATAWFTTPRAASYSADATIYVGARQFSTASASLSNDALLAIERVIRTFAEMIDSDPIAEAAVDRTNLPRSAGSVVAATTVIVEPGTQLLKVRVSDPSPQAAQELANAMADAFVERVQSLEPSAPAVEGTVPVLPAYIFQRAKLPVTPEPLGVGRKVVLAAIFGFLAAAALSFLLDYLDVTIKSVSDAERHLELPVLGVIPLERPSTPGRQSA